MKKKKWPGLILVMLAIGCSTSKITSSWKEQNIVLQKYNKVLALGLVHDADRTLQENMENHFVNDLKRFGYTAVSSMKEFGPKAFDKMDETAALAKLKNSGISAVITIVLVNREKERNYIPARVYYSSYDIYHDRFLDYQAALYRRTDEPGYYVTEIKYFWESNLYEIGAQKLVYSVQTRSFNPGSSESMAHEYGRMIVDDMVKQGILQNHVITGQRAF